MSSIKIKKGLSLLLAIIMMFTMMPTTIFTLGANENLPMMEVYTASSSGDYHKYYNSVYTVTFLDKIDCDAIDAAGFNCGVGSGHMQKIIRICYNELK